MVQRIFKRLKRNCLMCGTDFQFQFRWDTGHDAITAMWEGGEIINLDAEKFTQPCMENALIAEAASFAVSRHDQYRLVKLNGMFLAGKVRWFDLRKDYSGKVHCAKLTSVAYETKGFIYAWHTYFLKESNLFFVCPRGLMRTVKWA